MTNDSSTNDLVVNPGDDPPGDESTMTAILEGYAQGGFDSSFGITDDSEVECHTCKAVSSASTVSMNSLRRMEGASDPDDMIAVVALTCPECGARGTAVLGFGPMATLQDSEVLKALHDDRGDTTAPGNSAHGETRGDDTPRE